MNIILFGPPGAGKGTQADIIANDFNLYKVSSGNLLRKESQNSSLVGKKIKILLDKGMFVSDDIINDLVEKILLDNKINNRLIFDGYPRNLTQAKKLNTLFEKSSLKISCVLSLDVNKETVVKRILGRQICSKCDLIFNEYYNPATILNHKCDNKFLQKRSDDNKEVVEQRYETYLKETLPILNFYKKQNIHRSINGTAEINEIYKEIRDIIASLEA